jgi:hypothetical protein
MAARPAVQIPPPEADRPSWLRVGVVALIGFAVGVAWPRLTGVRLGPAAPAEAVSAVAAARAAAAASAAASASAAAPPPPASAAPAAPVITVSVGHGSVLSCKTDDGDTLKRRDCGAVTGLDPLARAQLERLSQAPAAAQNPGKLDVILNLDFENNHVAVHTGRSSTVKDPATLKAFLAGEMKSMSLKSVDHQYQHYSVLYVVRIESSAPGAAPEASAATPKPTTSAAPALPPDEAAVAWDTAIVRDAAHTGNIVARLPRGTKVKLGPSHGGWYQIQYGSGFASAGYVYRGAIGK